MPTVRIDALTLEGVGRFRAPITARFAAGLTVVHGPNEAGKSTLLAGIGATLFGVAQRDGLEDWRSDPAAERCAGILQFRIDTDCWTIERNFESHHTTVTAGEGQVVFSGDGNPAGKATGPRAYKRWLHDHLGFDDRATFEQTAFLHLREIPDALSYGAVVRELMSGAGAEDFSDVQTALEDEFGALTKINPWSARDRRNDARIERLGIEIAEKRETLRQADAAAGRTQSAQETLDGATLQHAALRDEWTTTSSPPWGPGGVPCSA